MSSIRAVIFDLDDTLYSERSFAFSGFDAVAKAYENRLGDRVEMAARMRRLFDSPNRPRVFHAFLAERGYPADDTLAVSMIETFRHHRPTIALHEDADRALTRLAGRYNLGLITDGLAVMQSAKIDTLGLVSRLDEMVLTESLGPGCAKPHPLAFERIALRLGKTALECLYVADNPAKDFVAPNALGWSTAQIRRSDGIYLDERPAPNGKPQHTLTTLDQLDSILI